MDLRGLTMEAAQSLTTSTINTVSRQIGSVKITDITIPPEAQEKTGRCAGRYITLEAEPAAQGVSAILQRAMSRLLPPRGRLLAVGLGNPDITHDSLGAAVVRTLTVRSGRRYSLCAIETDVTSKTGIDAARLVKAAAHELHADCVIAIDALSCASPAKIGRTVQLTNTGIIPGSGGGKSRLALTPQTLGIPIAAIGVPTITPLSSITRDKADSGYHITVPDIDVLIKMWAEVLAGAVDLLLG